MSKSNIFYLVIGIIVGGVGMYFISQANNSESLVESGERAIPGHSGMTMDDMVGGLVGKEGDEFDQAFLSGMIEHHIGAVEMSKLATSSANHPEIKAMAENIIRLQNQEIEMMRAWQETWGGTHH